MKKIIIGLLVFISFLPFTRSEITYVAEAQQVALTPKEMVAQAFADAPRMLDIIKCESGFRHFDKNGEVLRSYTDDVGIMQISEYYWLNESQKLGLNIYDIKDNIKMARIIYQRQGLKSWVCNRKV